MSTESEGEGAGGESAGRRAGAQAGGRAAPEDRSTCTPCRGTGRVSSALGGETHEVTCPWCGGSGQFAPGRDAQEEPAERADGAAAPADGGAAAEVPGDQ